MPEKITLEEKQALAELCGTSDGGLAEIGISSPAERAPLKEGIPDDAARKVELAVAQYKRSFRQQRSKATRVKQHMMFGSLWAVTGTLLIAISYSKSAPGGVFFIAWGAVLYGIIEFCMGLFGWLDCKS